MSPKLAAIIVVVAACGETPQTSSGTPYTPPGGGRGNVDIDTPEPGSLGMTSADHTPGFFRDLDRMLEAQDLLDDTTAVERLLVAVPDLITAPGTLPPLTSLAEDTRQALLVFVLRALQASQAEPDKARQIGEHVLLLIVRLDPACIAWNEAHPGLQVPTTTPGIVTLGRAADHALSLAAMGMPPLCQNTQAVTTFVPGDPVEVWVPENCTSDEWVDGYCEGDEWVDDTCYDVWVEEDCSGGSWEDDGYYQWRCYGSDDCRYVWVANWQYYQGDCNNGHYEEECYGGYWEDGICYDGYYVDGECTPGHWETTYSGGSWTFAVTQAPNECSSVRPMQYGVAQSFAEVAAAILADDLASQWQVALTELVASGELTEPSESMLAAVQQIIDAAIE